MPGIALAAVGRFCGGFSIGRLNMVPTFPPSTSPHPVNGNEERLKPIMPCPVEGYCEKDK